MWVRLCTEVSEKQTTSVYDDREQFKDVFIKKSSVGEFKRIFYV